MRPREALLLAIALAVLCTACSRLTFVKPDAKRRGMDRVAPEYSFRETREARDRATVRGLLLGAERKLMAGQLDGARADAEAALKIDRQSPTAHTLLALVASRQGRSEAAGQHYARAAELAPASGSALNNYGAWLCANGRAAESLDWFERAMQDPEYGGQWAGTLANAGACAADAGDDARAEPYLRAALATDPAGPVALAAMAGLQFRAGRYFEARAFSERGLAAAQATPEMLLLASQIEDKLGDSVAAHRYVQRLRTEFPQVRADIPGENAQP